MKGVKRKHRVQAVSPKKSKLQGLEEQFKSISISSQEKRMYLVRGDVSNAGECESVPVVLGKNVNLKVGKKSPVNSATRKKLYQTSIGGFFINRTYGAGKVNALKINNGVKTKSIKSSGRKQNGGNARTSYDNQLQGSPSLKQRPIKNYFRGNDCVIAIGGTPPSGAASAGFKPVVLEGMLEEISREHQQSEFIGQVPIVTSPAKNFTPTTTQD